ACGSGVPRREVACFLSSTRETPRVCNRYAVGPQHAGGSDACASSASKPAATAMLHPHLPELHAHTYVFTGPEKEFDFYLEEDEIEEQDACSRRGKTGARTAKTHARGRGISIQPITRRCGFPSPNPNPACGSAQPRRSPL